MTTNNPNGSNTGTVLRFYPQDVTVTSNPLLVLAKVEQCLVPQQILDGPADEEMVATGRGGKVIMSQIDNLQPFSAQFDKLHTFTAARLTVNMWKSTLDDLTTTFPQDAQLKEVVQTWKSEKRMLQINPHSAMVGRNAFYQRLDSRTCEMVFGYFMDNNANMIYTCRSPDIVAHETGHYVLDRLRPKFNESTNIQTGGLHEAFGDISALSFVLADDAMARSLINSTTGNLHASNNFAAQLAEQFGISLGFRGYLRNMDDDYTLSEVEQEYHAIAEVFTGAYYDALVSAFNEARTKYPQYNLVNLLQGVGEYARNLFLHAIATVPKAHPEFIDVVSHLIDKVIDQHSTESPPRVTYLRTLAWKDYFGNEFKRREVNKPGNQITFAPKKMVKQLVKQNEQTPMCCKSCSSIAE